MRNERVRLQPYVDAPLAKQLAAYSAATGKTTSFVVQAALRQYLDRTDDKMLLLGRLNGSVGHGSAPSATSSSSWRGSPST